MKIIRKFQYFNEMYGTSWVRHDHAGPRNMHIQYFIAISSSYCGRRVLNTV